MVSEINLKLNKTLTKIIELKNLIIKSIINKNYEILIIASYKFIKESESAFNLFMKSLLLRTGMTWAASGSWLHIFDDEC